MMRFHIVSLPHTQTTASFTACAYTQKVRKFCKMMIAKGHKVFLYSGEFNDAPCNAHICCIGEVERARAVGAGHYTTPTWDPHSSHWKTFNSNAIREINLRKQDHDFLCVIGGRAHEPISKGTGLRTVEFGIGYGGTFAPHRVWESYAWMHMVYGAQAGDPHRANGEWFDAVIPNYFDLSEFELADKADYYLYLGRLTPRKGYAIAQQVCERMGKKLFLAGPCDGQFSGYGTYVGEVGSKQRCQLMSRARAVFTPTVYVEPFGGVAVEAMLCGTPVISTDWGAFTETVVNGVTGYRCRTLAEFEQAVRRVRYLNPRSIRKYAADRYSLEAVAELYDAYFKRLSTLWGEGWYQRDEKDYSYAAA